MRIERLTKPALPLPTVVDCTDRADELPRLILLGAHAHGVGWRHIVRLWFADRLASASSRPARRPIVVDVGGRDERQRRAALAAEFAGGGVVTIEVLAARRLADEMERWNDVE